MYGKKVKLRVLFLFLLLSAIVLTVFLVLKSLEENVVYFLSPTEVKALNEIKKEKIRVGGMVKINFVITDFKNEIIVRYDGLVPNLFQEEKGVVAEGFLDVKNFFRASKILAKHDENYMPPEVKEALEATN